MHDHCNMERVVFHMQMVENGCAMRRERVFRDWENPFESSDYIDLYTRYRFRRHEILQILEEIKPEIKHRTNRNCAVTPENQILLALRFYATGSFQNLVGDRLGVHKSMVSKIIARVSTALANKVSGTCNIPCQ